LENLRDSIGNNNWDSDSLLRLITTHGNLAEIVVLTNDSGDDERITPGQVAPFLLGTQGNQKVETAQLYRLQSLGIGLLPFSTLRRQLPQP
jgi:hypothetical protein